MKYAIRQAVEADIPLLAQFEAEISRISFGEDAITDFGFHAKRLKKSLDQNPISAGMFVLVANEKVKGWLWMDAKTNFLTGDAYVNFRSFYLTDDIRGSEDGEALLKHGLAYCETVGAKNIVGKVHANNMPMRALYKKMGFEATHITMELKL